MTTTLRRTTTDDPQFAALVAELDAELVRRYGVQEELYFEHNAVAAIDTAIIVVDGTAPVGCGCFRRHHDATVELKRMYVAPAMRGRGLGAAIVGGLEAWARELGATDAILETGLGQPDAIALYRKCGYATIPNYPPYDRLPNSTCMTKRLA